MKSKSTSFYSSICAILFCSSELTASTSNTNKDETSPAISTIDELIWTFNNKLSSNYNREKFWAVYKDNEDTFSSGTFELFNKTFYKQGAQSSFCSVNTVACLFSLLHYDLTIDKHPLALVDLYNFKDFVDYSNMRKEHLLDEFNIYNKYPLKDLKNDYQGIRMSKFQYNYDELINQEIFTTDSKGVINGVNKKSLENLMEEEFNSPKDDLHRCVYNWQFLNLNGGILIPSVARRFGEQYGLKFTSLGMLLSYYIENFNKTMNIDKATTKAREKVIEEMKNKAWILVGMDDKRKHAVLFLRKSENCFLKIDPLSSTKQGDVYKEKLTVEEFIYKYMSNELIWAPFPSWLTHCKCCCSSRDFQSYKSFINHPLLPDYVKATEEEEFRKNFSARKSYLKTQSSK